MFGHTHFIIIIVVVMNKIKYTGKYRDYYVVTIDSII